MVGVEGRAEVTVVAFDPAGVEVGDHAVHVEPNPDRHQAFNGVGAATADARSAPWCCRNHS
jgi:hypothetical protein